ncbi:hypothetical protein CP532_1644 [Ophiocordyceps camponoti-leonardi (nom. inval.)]|nr:hypothetical protein CP532_1644 [Ophiocordyceps camponoti-leonardi (nom. inval.)]
MRPVSLSADPDASRPDILPSHTPVVPISCFITTEANLETLDSAAAIPDFDHPPKHQSQGSPGGRSSTFSDRSAYHDLGYGSVTAPPATGVVDSHSVASGLSSLGISSNSSTSGDAIGFSTKPASGEADVCMAAHNSLHQLVMPSLTVPRRRSFTDVGKSLGNLRILVCGQAGIGKTSLIRSFGQNCQHIVYLDPITSSPNQRITEILGSTKFCPWWRAESEPVARANKRRKFTTDELLEKNICFADCPPTTSDVTGYVESHLMQLCQKPIGDSDLCHLLSGGAGSVVHAVLYMLPTTEDIRIIRTLQEMTNVIPVLARADELTDEEAMLSKRRLLSHLARENLDLFSFAGPDSAPSIYAVSCTAQSENTASDPDLHMSFEHVQQQVLTDLSDLIDRIFSIDGSSWLRHSAAVKSVSWRRRQLELTYHSALTLRSLTYSGTVTSPCHFAAGPHDERIDLSSWAESLRRSLAAERMRESYAALPSEVERVELAMTKSGKPLNKVPRRQRGAGQTSSVHQDPLGLLKLSSQVNRGGRLTLELVTSLGGVGLAAWLVQPELARHWDLSWCTAAI